jgi:hypothetical protein
MGNTCRSSTDLWPADFHQPLNDEQMGSTPFGDADLACLIGFATPQQFEFHRGDRGRVGAAGCA